MYSSHILLYCAFFLQEFFEYLADKSGYDAVNLTNVGHLQSTLYIEVCGSKPMGWEEASDTVFV